MAYTKTSLPSFIVGILVLAYLSTFIFFAIIRILTGVSIQRLWWSGLRHINFTPKEGVRVSIRGLRLSIHRPTFARPTWLSIVFTELKVTIDLKLFGNKSAKKSRWAAWSKNSSAPKQEPARPQTPENSSSPIPKIEVGSGSDSDEGDEERSRTWQKLTHMKERIKKLHRQISWIRLVDVVATNTSLNVIDVGSLEITSLTMAVDTRQKLVDRSRLFRHRKPKDQDQRPAEWIVTLRSILFSPTGKESVEVLDHATLNVYGNLSQKLEGLRDASIALKLGRVSVPYDDFKICSDKTKDIRRQVHEQQCKENEDPKYGATLGEVAGELEKPGSQSQSLGQAVSDSKEFVGSILRGIQEVQFAVSYFGFTKSIQGIDATRPVHVNMAMKEVGFDLLRLEQNSPAHLMYFSREDVAHQALVTATSVAVGIDDGHEHPERLLYIPMATATLRTTLPSKTIQFSNDGGKNVAERNANILAANLVVTSPSVDLDPKHLPLMLAIMERRRNKQDSQPKKHKNAGRQVFSALLPKATVKVSINEPVIRVALPCADQERRKAGEFDLLISSMSSMSLDIDSSHSPDGDHHYALAAVYRVNSHHFYYQTAAHEKHDLLVTDTFEIRLQVHATPDLSVQATVNAQTFSVYMVRPEISEGVRQIVTHLQQDTFRHHLRQQKKQSQGPTFLRKLPSWLLRVEARGTDFNYYVAGVDDRVTPDAKGLALHLEDWTAEYKADRNDDTPRPTGRRRIASRSSEDMYLKTGSPSPSRRRSDSETDGRRLAVHLKGFEAFVLESLKEPEEVDKFLAMPNFEVAFSTSTDHQGPLMHVNSYARRVYAHYKLSHHYCVGVAILVLRNTFEKSKSRPPTPVPQEKLSPLTPNEITSNRGEITTFDFKAGLLQLKANMPADPRLMIQIFDVKAGRHRWSNPFLRAHLARLYAQAPTHPTAWARILSLRTPRVEVRHVRQKSKAGILDEHSIDVVTDAIRFGVPHGLVVHKIFDNIVNLIKTTKQLHFRFETGSDEFILEKEPEGPKHIPKISVHSRSLLFEIEDDEFENKLGLIYLQGLLEQKQRLAREDAYNLKVRRIEEADLAAKRLRNRPTHQVQSRPTRNHKRRASEESRFSRRAVSPEPEEKRSRSSSPRKRKLIFDPEGSVVLSETAKRSVADARLKADQYNASSWKRRIEAAYAHQHNRVQDVRRMVWGMDAHPGDIEQNELVLEIPIRPSLLALVVNEVTVNIDKPSFPLNELPNFMNKMGKGLPLDTQFGLLVPLHLKIQMGETRALLRDYPLPLLHIPHLKNGQSARLPSISIETDFVVGEEFRDHESIRDVRVTVVEPKSGPAGDKNKGLIVDVLRTVSAVKTYSDFAIEINTGLPTRITWGTSYQPAIQDVMQTVEGFTKPPIDPSERVGFWDKLRLNFHSRFNIKWKGEGDVHLVLKGSRDPYKITGVGAGLVMCWRGDVHWTIRQDSDPKKFMIVDAAEYILAVPDFNQYARRHLNKEEDALTGISSASYDAAGKFKKTLMKLSGNVRWQVGMVFERTTTEGKRSFDFKPHYGVTLKNPKYAKADGDHPYDAFRGFRSNHIHLSIAVISPLNRDWTVTNIKASQNYNSIHLSPRSFAHFFDWWSMFQGNLSLPVRQGKLWSGPEKTSKKFGRHLATIKYNLLLSPLFVSHVYKHKDPEDYSNTTVSATGLKVKIDSLMLDMHQRREEFRQPRKEGSDDSEKETKTTGMKINAAQLDLIAADFRAVSQTIKGTNANDLDEATDETLKTLEQSKNKADPKSFTIPDRNLDWVDMDDFVELDWILPAESNPDTQILPLAFAPRFTYFRNTDHHGMVHGDPLRSSPFGNEDTHYCVMTERNDPRRVQCDLIQERLTQVVDQVDRNRRSMGDQELKVIREVSVVELSKGMPIEKGKQRMKLEKYQQHQETLLKKQKFLEAMQKVLLARIDSHTNDFRAVADVDSSTENFFDTHPEYSVNDPEVLGLDSAPLNEDVGDFNNRFIVHNVQLKWDNALRNIMLRYFHQVSQRRGFVYYMSRNAVKFILDIVEEQKSKRNESIVSTSDRYENSSNAPLSRQGTAESINTQSEVEERIEELLQDGKNFVEADDPDKQVQKEPTPKPSRRNTKEKANVPPNDQKDKLSDTFIPQNAYHVRLIAPQIQLQSAKGADSAAVISAKGMQLKVIQVMDKDRIHDDVSGLVQRRISATMDSLQIFIADEKKLSPEWADMYSANRFGAKPGSVWPPWLPLEAMYDFDIDPVGFARAIQRTSATMRYDKFNKLRLKYNDNIPSGKPGESSAMSSSEDQGMDHLWVDFPKMLAKLDQRQYIALYNIVTDLLLYSEPLEKTRAEKLEKILLASDFSDLSDAPEMVIKLQEKLRTLHEIKAIFQINEPQLSRQQWKERIALEEAIVNAEEELFFIMSAITTSQRKNEDRTSSSQAQGTLKWDISAESIAWLIIGDEEKSLAELQLKGAVFHRTDLSDGSNANEMEIARIEGYNMLPNALYPQMIAPFVEQGLKPLADDQKMVSVRWMKLEAIGGIPIIQNFTVDVFPLRLQLEREVGEPLQEYFTSMGDKSKKDSGSSARHDRGLPAHREEDEDDDEAVSGSSSPTLFDSPGNQLDDASGAGDLALRLQPTLTLPDKSPKPSPKRRTTSMIEGKEGAGARFRSHFSRDKKGRDAAAESTSALLRPKNTRASSSMSVMSVSKTTSETPSRFKLHRTNSESSQKSGVQIKSERSSDRTQVNQMIMRAGKYMALGHVKISETRLCLSWKNKSGKKDLLDVHDLVFRMPMLEYDNKIWSNLDLLDHVKKALIKVAFKHVGTVISNKFHRDNNQPLAKIKDVASHSMLLGSSSRSQTATNSSAASSRASTSHSSAVSKTSSERARTSQDSNRNDKVSRFDALDFISESEESDAVSRPSEEYNRKSFASENRSDYTSSIYTDSLHGDRSNSSARSARSVPHPARSIHSIPENTDAPPRPKTADSTGMLSTHSSGQGLKRTPQAIRGMTPAELYDAHRSNEGKGDVSEHAAPPGANGLQSEEMENPEGGHEEQTRTVNGEKDTESLRGAIERRLTSFKPGTTANSGEGTGGGSGAQSDGEALNEGGAKKKGRLSLGRFLPTKHI